MQISSSTYFAVATVPGSHCCRVGNGFPFHIPLKMDLGNACPAKNRWAFGVQTKRSQDRFEILRIISCTSTLDVAGVKQPESR